MIDDFPAYDQNPAPTPEAGVERDAPVVNLRTLKTGTTLLVEADPNIYELVVRHPEQGLVQVSSNLPMLRTATLGQFLHCVNWKQPAAKLNVIYQGWSLVLKFANGVHQTKAVTSVRVCGVDDAGKRWSYDVF